MSNIVRKCSLCGKCFTSLKLLEEHRTNEHSEIFHTCSTCVKRFTNPDRLKDHTDGHRRNTHSCKFCGQICNDEGDLYIHLTTSHKNRERFVCDVCWMEFSDYLLLKKHIKRVEMRKRPSMIVKTELFCSIHSKQESFDDQVLEIELLETDISQKFAETQIDEMPEAEKFRSTDYREESALGNSPKNPESPRNSGEILACSMCKKKFTNLRMLRCHEEAHLKQKHSCKFCGKVCNEELDIYIHLTTIHKDIHKALCDLCGSKLLNNFTLKKHITDVHTRRLESITEKAKSFCTIHSRQRYFDDRELQNEINLLNISEVFSGSQENVVSGGNSYTGQNEEIALGYGPDNTEDHQLLSNSAKEAETVAGTEKNQEVAATKCNSINPEHSDVGHSPHFEMRMQLPSAENHPPNPDWSCTIAGTEHPNIFENISGIVEQRQKQETNAFRDQSLSVFDSSPYSYESTDTCEICGMKFSDLNELVYHLVSHAVQIFV